MFGLVAAGLPAAQYVPTDRMIGPIKPALNHKRPLIF
jgi:hypothetical protein